MPKILIIDDEQDEQEAIAALLKKLLPDSYVLPARSAAEGMEKAEEESPDIILLSAEIGQTSGFEVCERLKYEEATKYIPIIMLMAGMSGPENRVRGLQCGASAVLPTPIYEAELLAQVNTMLQIKQAHEERKELERMLLEAQKMEAIGSLAGGIAHDFNNILTAIIGYTELAVGDVTKETQTYDNLQEVLKAGHRAKDLVKQLLSFSRQRGHEKKPFQISLLVKEDLKMLKASLPPTIQVREQIQTDSGKVLADPSQIHQMLVNLYTNAVDAMKDKDGVLEVRLEDFDLDAHMRAENLDLSPGPYVRLVVSDTGHGISPASVRRIFDPHILTEEKRHGAGLGLVVVHEIVKGHGGGITVQSETGKGTTITIYFPRIPGEARVEKEVCPSIPRGKELILFIDDDRALAHLGKQMLERLGYEVISRTSGIEGLKAFNAQPEKFALVITDLTMPKMTGIEFAKNLLEIRPNIPIILCSGFGEKVTKEKLDELGIREFVMKPIVIGKIEEVINRVLGQEKG